MLKNTSYYCRASFSALTNAELTNAYNNLGHPDKYQAMSVDARQELDLKIGVAFSRLMTRTYLDMAREKFRLKDQKVISYGPCQTPTLWFCVQRHKEIQNFRPQQYFYVSVQINVMGRGVVEFLWADGDRVNSRYKIYLYELYRQVIPHRLMHIAHCIVADKKWKPWSLLFAPLVSQAPGPWYVDPSRKKSKRCFVPSV